MFFYRLFGLWEEGLPNLLGLNVYEIRPSERRGGGPELEPSHRGVTRNRHTGFGDPVADRTNYIAWH